MWWLSTTEQCSCGVGGKTRFAQGRTTALAGRAVAATGHEGRDDMIADDEIRYSRAHLFDDAGAFVAEHHR